MQNNGIPNLPSIGNKITFCQNCQLFVGEGFFRLEIFVRIVILEAVKHGTCNGLGWQAP